MDIKKIRIAAFEDMDEIITAIEKILDKINMGILKDFSQATLQDFPILDIDKSTHSLESKKREKAVPGFNKKNKGKPCYQ